MLQQADVKEGVQGNKLETFSGGIFQFCGNKFGGTHVSKFSYFTCSTIGVPLGENFLGIHFHKILGRR